MNRTVNINIAGSVFHIDEQAFETLSTYLRQLREHFSGADGQDEIIADIEARIAEMFREQMGATRQAISMEDVELVIASMGRPESFGDQEEEATAATTDAGTSADKGPKRLFRDPDDKVIGGVCSGISHYLGITDPIWLRLALAISIFGFGSGILLYIILWAIIPKAKSTAEKLQMRGENVTVSNIEKRVSEEFEELKERVSGMTGNSKAVDSVGSGLQKLIGLFVNLASLALKVVAILVGVALLGIGITWFIATVISIFFIPDFMSLDYNGTVSRVMIDNLLGQLFPSGWHALLFRIGSLLAFGIPALVIAFFGTRLIVGYKLRNRYVILPALGLWILGVVMALGTGFTAMRNFSETYTDRSVVAILPSDTSAVIYLDLSMDTMVNRGTEFNEFMFDLLISEDGTKFHGRPSLNVIESPDGQTNVVIKRFSRGKNRKEALHLANGLNYNLNIDDSVVQFGPWFEFPQGDTWRGQKIMIEVQVPVGTTIHLSEQLEQIIYDIKNVNGTYDGDMGGRRWKMKSYGLECVDCADLKPMKHSSSRKWNDDDDDELSEDIDDARQAEEVIDQVKEKMDRIKQEIEEDRLRMEEKMRQKEEELREMQEEIKLEQHRKKGEKAKEEADANSGRILLKREVTVTYPTQGDRQQSITFTLRPDQS